MFEVSYRMQEISFRNPFCNKNWSYSTCSTIAQRQLFNLQ